MNRITAIFIIILVTVSCATIPPQISEFRAVPDRIEEGATTIIHWNVTGAENVSITGIGDDLLPIGQKEIQLINSSTFNLIAKNGNEVINKSIYIEVIKKEVEKPKSIPIIEKRNTQKSDYLKGVVNAENVKLNDKPTLHINLIDIKSYPNKVKLFCSVKDQNGNHIANLAPPFNNAFVGNWKSLIEEIEGKDYAITDFSVEEIREDIAPPFTTSFVMDYSGSMENDYHFVNKALEKAVAFIRPNKDDYEVFQFDHRVYKSIPLTSHAGNIQNIIPFHALAGWTAFYKASYFAIEEIQNSQKEKVAILFTDGIDNASIYSAFDVVLKARKINAKVFIIGFNRQFGGFFQEILEAIADQSGGKAYFPSSLSELDDIFAEIYQMMKVYYIVSYTASKEVGNLRLVKLSFEFPYINQLLMASKKYYAEPVTIDETRIMSVAWFKFGKSDIQDEDMLLIKDIAQILKENPNKKILITGHTDSQGSNAINNALSLKRAKSVAKIFRDLGVKKNQILKIEGKGKNELLYPNELNDYEKFSNRRVNIQFV